MKFSDGTEHWQTQFGTPSTWVTLPNEPVVSACLTTNASNPWLGQIELRFATTTITLGNGDMSSCTNMPMGGPLIGYGAVPGGVLIDDITLYYNECVCDSDDIVSFTLAPIEFVLSYSETVTLA